MTYDPQENQSFIITYFPGQENQIHNQVLSSELKTSEIPFNINTKAQDTKPHPELQKKHKVPLTVAGKIWEQ
jgi:hypothetical protein